MRDPLAWVPIRLKLPLGFLLVCVVAFGVGGVVLTRTAGNALETEIRQRLDEQARATALTVERHLDLQGRRVEDFASDGYIRVQAEALATAPDEAIEAGLKRHLVENKLPIVEPFVDAAVVDVEGTTLLVVSEPPDVHVASGGTSFSPLLAATDAHPYPTFVIATGLWSLEGRRPIGSLQILVRADTWAAGVPDLAASGATLTDPVSGFRLPGRAPAPGGPDEQIRYEIPVARNGWQCAIAVNRAEAMRPIRVLRDRYLLIGLVLLGVVAFVLFFPMRFLLKPLAHIAEAARRIADGDFRARVTSESHDEIGDLSRAFNIMAHAVEERAGELERTAARLERRERDVRFERDRLHAVIRTMEDGLFILDAEGEVRLSNAAAAPLLRELAKKREGRKRFDCAEDGERPEDCLQCLGDGGRKSRSCIVPAGSRIFEVHVTALPADDGRPAGRLCVSRDITTRIAEADGQAHQERMAVLGEVAAVMAHELNNPLSAIAMFGQMLESELEEGTEARESAEIIRRNTEACRRSIQGLLDLAAHATPEADSFDVHGMLEDVEHLLRPIYQRAGVAQRVVAEAEDPTVFGDELQLRQVIVNLVMNAVQAIDEAGGCVTVATRDVEDQIEIEVRDTGPGIPADVQSKIFEPFFTTKAPGTGTGLGLPTSRRIVEAHGGTLEVASTGSEGTVFRLRLPREGSASSWRTQVRLARQVQDVTVPPKARTRGSVDARE